MTPKFSVMAELIKTLNTIKPTEVSRIFCKLGTKDLVTIHAAIKAAKETTNG